MRPTLLLVTFLAATGLAAPTSGILDDVYGFSAELAEFYARVGKHISDLKRAGNPSPTCDLSKAALPAQASGLPAPPAGQKLLHVAVGRGTQVCILSSRPHVYSDSTLLFYRELTTTLRTTPAHSHHPMLNQWP